MDQQRFPRWLKVLIFVAGVGAALLAVAHITHPQAFHHDVGDHEH